MRLRIVFWLDAALLILFCALEAVPSTGLLMHEWLGLAVIPLLVVHLLLSWSWISSTTKGLLRAGSIRPRVNYFLNLALFGIVSALIFSGIMISQEAVPSVTGKTASLLDPQFSWGFIHKRSSDIALVLACFHLAINWTWSVAAARKILRLKAEAQ